MTDGIPSIIPDWLASLFALYCLTGTALLTVVFGWAAYETAKKAWLWLRLAYLERQSEHRSLTRPE